ncbi:uncharacterized protein [Dysidea avara]|uniref:uncharacterized protein n=1 Tax=Dysidea avara TaxID=196820 RepID=UPI003322C2B3
MSHHNPFSSSNSTPTPVNTFHMLPFLLCTELSSKLSETTSQPLQETVIKKKSVFNKAQEEYSDQWVKFNQQDKDSVKVCSVVVNTLKIIYTTSSFSAWEQLLDELEAVAKLCTELSNKLSEITSQPLQETVIKKKSVLKKIFTARDDLNAKVDKAEIAVNKAQKEYSDQWVKFNQQDKDSVKGFVKVANIVLLNIQETFQAEAQQLEESITKCEKDLKSLKTLYERGRIDGD